MKCSLYKHEDLKKTLDVDLWPFHTLVVVHTHREGKGERKEGRERGVLEKIRPLRGTQKGAI